MNGLFRFAFAFCLVVSMAKPVLSQSRNTGEIRGTVADTSGAVVAGATVTLSNIDTGETKDFITNQDGIYDTVSTPAGNYKLTFAASGFKKVVLGPFTLNVDVITQNASLEIGAVTETVVVTETGVPLLDTETSHMGTVWEAQTIGVLPQIGAGITGNDWANFNILLPGAAGAPSQPGAEGSGSLQCRGCRLDQRKPPQLRELPAGRRSSSITGQQQRGQHVVRGPFGGASHDLFVLRGIRHRRRRIQPDHEERNQQHSRVSLRILAEYRPERSPVFSSSEQADGSLPESAGVLPSVRRVWRSRRRSDH